MELTLAVPAATAVRTLACPRCHKVAGIPCAADGDHLQRWTAAYTAGLVGDSDMTAVFEAVLVITHAAIVPAGVTA